MLLFFFIKKGKVVIILKVDINFFKIEEVNIFLLIICDILCVNIFIILVLFILFKSFCEIVIIVEFLFVLVVKVLILLEG